MARLKAKDCSIGIFWEDEPKPKKQETFKIIPPQVWLNDDYLPGLEDARKFDVKLINDFELVQLRGGSFTSDIETFKNYSLFAAIHEESERVIFFESFNDSPLDIPKLKWVMQHFTFTGFNSYRFDIPITNLMLSGCTNEQIKEAANLIIEAELRPDDVYSHFNIEPLQGIDHIDLISLVPKDINGVDLQDQDKNTLTLGMVAINALMGVYKDENISPEEKFVRFKIGMKIHGNANVELEVSEIAKIKDLIGKAYGPWIVGRLS